MNQDTGTDGGAQRLPLEKLKAWEALQFGLFLSFGMSTYAGEELPDGKHPSGLYAPDRLDVDQWVCVARDAGMKYAVLTAKHVAGHCLWPSDQTDYHVGTSGNTTDVVEAFVNACEKRGILPGLYYCSWDNHHRFGSLTPSDMPLAPCVSQMREPFTTRQYQDFQMAQLGELLTRYGPIAEVWIDIPGVLPRGFRNDLYAQIAAWQPESVIMMNHGIGDGSQLRVHYAWPTDLIAIERFLPNSHTGHAKWRDVEGKRHYLPGEVCDPVGREWFFAAADRPRDDRELLGMALVSITRGANLLLDVGPDKHGLITEPFSSALLRLRNNLGHFGL
jgi:alpha-L-fucosidase